jgi:hypothetical protein
VSSATDIDEHPKPIKKHTLRQYHGRRAGWEAISSSQLRVRLLATTARCRKAGLMSSLYVSDAERLPFKNRSFDLVYS